MSENRQVNLAEFKKYLERISFADSGDYYERNFSNYLAETFPNCEIFWRKFVVPLTERVNGYPESITGPMGFRPSIDSEPEDISMLHYSVFMNLIFARLHLENPHISTLESVYTHLVSACDCAQSFLEKWYLLLLACRGEQSRILSGLSLDEFLQIMTKWYDKKYKHLYKNYHSKGRPAPIYPPLGKYMLEEYFGEDDSFKEYHEYTRDIRKYRNVIVHDVRIGRIIDLDGQVFIPKISRIGEYKSWRKVAEASGKKEIIERDFAEQSQQCSQNIRKVEALMNSMWAKAIRDFEEEFYSHERSLLRQKFKIEFATGFTDMSFEEIFVSALKVSRATYTSGTHGQPSGGTLDYPADEEGGE